MHGAIYPAAPCQTAIGCVHNGVSRLLGYVALYQIKLTRDDADFHDGLPLSARTHGTPIA
jgi:hypothetical protein